MTVVTHIIPRVYVDEEGHAFLAVDHDGVQMWDVYFDDKEPIGFSAPNAREAEAGALAYLTTHD